MKMNLAELEARFGLQKDGNAKRRTFVSGAVKGINEQARTIRAYASTNAWDRYGERFEADAFKDGLANFKQNPVILFGHDYGSAPIGKAIDYEFDAKGLILTMKFANTPEAEKVFALYAGGFMSAFSVGFRPLEYRFEERIAGSGEMGAVFVKAELLENSAVPVPANPEAVVIKGVSGEMTLGAFLDSFRAIPRKGEEEPAPEPAAPAAEPAPAAPAAAPEPVQAPAEAPKGLKEALGALISIGKAVSGKVTDEAVRSLLIQANNLCRELVYGRGVESLDGIGDEAAQAEIDALVKEYAVLIEAVGDKVNDKDREELLAFGKTIEKLIEEKI